MNVLGHHSTAEFWSNEYTNSKQWKEDKIQRQTAENWDCPIVVSTAVQFFESLFCSRPGAARKIHNLVNTVIILDEVQTMPTNLLYPLFQMLKILVDVYHCSIVFTTATMPPVSQLLQTVHEDSSWNAIRIEMYRRLDTIGRSGRRFRLPCSLSGDGSTRFDPAIGRQMQPSRADGLGYLHGIRE